MRLQIFLNFFELSRLKTYSWNLSFVFVALKPPIISPSSLQNPKSFHNLITISKFESKRFPFSIDRKRTPPNCHGHHHTFSDLPASLYPCSTIIDNFFFICNASASRSHCLSIHTFISLKVKKSELEAWYSTNSVNQIWIASVSRLDLFNYSPFFQQT